MEKYQTECERWLRVNNRKRTSTIIIICEHKIIIGNTELSSNVCVFDHTIGQRAASSFIHSHHRMAIKQGGEKGRGVWAKSTQIDFVNILWHFIPWALYADVEFIALVLCSFFTLSRAIIANWAHDDRPTINNSIQPRARAFSNSYTRQIFISLFISTSNKYCVRHAKIYST